MESKNTTQMNISTKRLTNTESRLVVAGGGVLREGQSGSVGLADAN